MSVYGRIANKISENYLCKPISVYGKSKLLGEKIFKVMTNIETKLVIKDFLMYMDKSRFQ